MLLNISKLAEITGFSRDTVSSRLQNAGVVESQSSTKTNRLFESALALRALYALPTGSGLDLTRERARLTALQTVKLTRELERDAKIWVLAERVERETGMVWQEVSRWLENLPDEIERDTGCEPAIVTAINSAIDKARLTLSARLADAHQQIEKEGA
jgi:hypothetical protein